MNGFRRIMDFHDFHGQISDLNEIWTFQGPGARAGAQCCKNMTRRGLLLPFEKLSS